MSKYTPVNWKEKYNERSSKLKASKKRVKEITISRDNWKRKYMEVKKGQDLMLKELNSIKKKIRSIIT